MASIYARKRASSVFLSLFLIAPFLWAPGLSPDILSVSRKVLICIAVLATIIYYRGTLYSLFSQRELTAFSILIVVTALYTLAFTIPGDFKLISTLLTIIISFSIGRIIYASRRAIFEPRGGSLIVLIAVIALLALQLEASLLGYIDPINPLQARYSEDLFAQGYFRELLTLSQTGYGIGRTSWSISIFFVAMILLQGAQGLDWSIQKILAVTGAILALASTLLVGSKGGLIYVALFAALFTIRASGRHAVGVSFGIGLATLLFLASPAADLLGYYRIGAQWQDLSGGRADNISVGIELAKSVPWFGFIPVGGYNLFEFGFQYRDVHNAWLHNYLNYGPLVSILLLIFIAWITFRSITAKIDGEGLFFIRILLLTGLISTLYEPESIFSDAHYGIVYWFCAGYVFGPGRYKNYKYKFLNSPL